MRRRPAFTLLETVVALAIFLVVSMVVVDIFISASSQERRGVSREQVIASGRAALERITHDLRLGTPEGTYGMNGTYPLLSIRNPDGSSTIYYTRITGLTDQLAACTSPVGVTGCDPADTSAWRPITTARAQVADFKVYVAPSTDPFLPGATSVEQPRTTIALTLRSLGRANEQISTTIQTTVVSRYYVP